MPENELLTEVVRGQRSLQDKIGDLAIKIEGVLSNVADSTERVKDHENRIRDLEESARQHVTHEDLAREATARAVVVAQKQSRTYWVAGTVVLIALTVISPLESILVNHVFH